MNFQQTINRDEFKVKYYVHVFPTENFDWDSIKIDVDKKVIYVKHLFDFHSSVSTKSLPKFWCFKGNRIFFNCCQDEVYSTVACHMAQQVFLGVDHVLMSYGQNYSGKSFTLSGFHNQFDLRGIIPRFVVDLFKRLEVNVTDYAPEVYISAVDIYKNSISDLLSHTKRVCKEQKEVREVRVSSETDCLEVLFKAEAQRSIIGNKFYNSHSSSNVVTFTVRLVSVNRNEPDNKISKIHFVDLAGVETILRNPKTSFKDPYIQGDANVTKTMLELFALRSKKKDKPEKRKINQNIHILTRYLNKSFSTSSYITLLCHIRPTHEDIMITLSTLKFGKICQGIPLGKPEEHTERNYDMTYQKLAEEIKLLKDELLLKNLTEQKTPIKLSQERIDFVKRMVNSFLNEEISENDLLSLVDDPNLILNIVKSIHNQPVLKASVTLQTESLHLTTPRSSFVRKESKKDSLSRKSTTRKMTVTETPKAKGKKSQDPGKSKVEKVELLSEETQVNLIEPNVVLPNLESREGLWAMFLISRPDIHKILENLNDGVAGTNKSLYHESNTYDTLNQLVNKTQLALNQEVTYRHTETQETYDQEGKVLVPEGEAKLVQELRQLQRELDQSKQKLIDAQFDWLEALEKLNKEKEAIEEEFKQFCVDNNFLMVDNRVSEPEEVSEPPKGDWDTDDELKRLYHSLQKKYLHKGTL